MNSVDSLSMKTRRSRTESFGERLKREGFGFIVLSFASPGGV